MLPDILIVATLLDIMFNDPFWLYHPVQFFGTLSIFIEKLLRKIRFLSLYVLGILHWFIIVGFCITVFWVISHFLSSISLELVFLFTVYVVYSFLAIGSLLREVRAISGFLSQGDVEGARRRVQGIVSRNMVDATETDIVRATIESATENISDGIVAPLFFFGIGGPIMMLIYKIINTLDSTIGYRNERYQKFGWFSARVDDVFNFIPARITGFLILITAWGMGDSVKGAWQAWMKDAQRGTSPNGGIPIVTYAGARDLRLGGPCFDAYGEVIPVPFVGGTKKVVQAELKVVARYIAIVSAFMFCIALVFVMII